MEPDFKARLASIGAQLPPTTRLLAVSKGQPAAAIRAAVAAGQRSFAESRLQEALAKRAELVDLEPLDWHFIGRLQANKVRPVLRAFGTLHSIDSLELAQRVARIAAEETLAPKLLFQVKFLPDPSKSGLTPEQLQQNIAALVEALNKAKPATSKGVYLRKVSVSSTMGPGIRVDVGTFAASAGQ